ncbi:MAG: imidazoleglycerol-phosphate dehydratase [Thermoleophilales bacterium]|jgi:imidazoleglycerol-phosphate dehydratase|nr:imidazoleglycerol-phosphate dehydratase [Thermoleophilales bacterium]
MTDYKGMQVTRDGDVYRTHRESREALVKVALDFGPRREPELATGLAFFDHMLEMLGWYADFGVDASYDVKTYRLMHVVMEDTGLALGAAMSQAIRDRIADGVESSGYAHGMMDEASAFAQVSFEGRSSAHVTRAGAAAFERVEDVLCVDLVAFFEGFSQGGRCTVQLRLDDGSQDPHHAWEAAFRAFARALRAALSPNSRRAGMTAGVKGTLD